MKYYFQITAKGNFVLTTIRPGENICHEFSVNFFEALDNIEREQRKEMRIKLLRLFRNGKR